MKILLNASHTVGKIHPTIMINYLRMKNDKTPMFIYTEDKRQYVRTDIEEYIAQPLKNRLHKDDVLLSEDLGENIPFGDTWSTKNINCREKMISTSISDYRYDEDFINYVENMLSDKRHMPFLKIEEIPDGTAYRIIEYDNCEGIEYKENEEEWLIAKSSKNKQH